MLDSLSSIIKIQKAVRAYLSRKKSAAVEIQRMIRGYLIRKKIKIKAIGPGIINTHIKIQKPSELLGEEFRDFDRIQSGFEVMITRIDPMQTDVLLVTDQGTPDHLMKYLKQENATYGAMINGGFYAINGFYYLRDDAPIGLHRYKKNYLSTTRKRMHLHSNPTYDNTEAFFSYTENVLSKKYEEYAKTEIESQLHLKTQLPSSVREEYGIIRINHQGMMDIQRISAFQSNEDFKTYQKDAKYLLSTGPILVENNEVVFTEDKLQDERFQFNVVKNVLGTHPGSVPPGSFYHADQPNPRSAIGLTQQGEILMVTLKGDESPSSRDGMTLPQFAQLTKVLKIKIAVNLDGGYSACQGIYNTQTMLTARFIRSRSPCNERVLPCSIIAQEKVEQTEDPQKPETEIFLPQPKRLRF